MGEPGYSGNIGYSPRETMRNSVSALAGLAGIVAASAPGFAQEPTRIAYENTNLSQYNVPNVEGLKPYQTKKLDLTDKIPGNETQFDIYKIGKAMMGVYSVAGKQYAIVFDPDGKPPAAFAFVDKTGNGSYTEISATKPFTAPNWVSK